MLTPSQIHHAIYAGFLGKAIGVRLGAPVEPTIWTYDRIRDTYGEITRYMRDFKTFAADDDTNGPVYFIRALRDFGLDAGADEMGRTWLNYAADGHGMYWWGGFNVSTEHTAYTNLRAGIPAPRSGSIAQNGAAVAEQIGGQIFIDSWGWVFPGQPETAAERAAAAASVAHDGEGLNGARWVAAAIAAAFEAETLDEVIAAAMSVIDADSIYASVARAVLDFHNANPDDWRACREMLSAEWGYDRYPGVCHIVPNAGIMVMAIVYGAGDLCRTVEIATMAGWDTDCNAGNAGAIIGTFQGLDPSWNKYRGPVNDMIVASGVAGSLNVVDLPSFAQELAVLALRLSGRDVPPLWTEDFERKGVRFDFILPGATHGFRTEGCNKIALTGSQGGEDGALCVLLDRLQRGEGGRIFWKPFYRRTDFDDERYAPMFSPLVSDGQTATMRVRLEPWEGDGNLRIVPYVRLSLSGEIVRIGGWQVPEAEDGTIAFEVPDSGGEMVDEIGLLVEYFGRLKFLGKLWISEFSVVGPGRRVILPERLCHEWGGLLGFTRNRGRWTLEDGMIQGHTGTDADAWTGNYYATDQSVAARVVALAGTSHLLTARVQGTARFYAAGFVGGEFVLAVEDFGTTILARAPFSAKVGTAYDIVLSVTCDALSARVEGGPELSATDSRYRYGMAGLRLGGPGRMRASRFTVDETV